MEFTVALIVQFRRKCGELYPLVSNFALQDVVLFINSPTAFSHRHHFLSSIKIKISIILYRVIRTLLSALT